MHVKHNLTFTIPQIRPTNVLLTAVITQIVMVYTTNLMNNVKQVMPKKINNILNKDKPLKW